LAALPFDLGLQSFLEIILPVDPPPAALPMLAHGLADITVERKLKQNKNTILQLQFIRCEREDMKRTH
jgi:hypothetical protein